jgi:hypothetical protein
MHDVASVDRKRRAVRVGKIGVQKTATSHDHVRRALTRAGRDAQELDSKRIARLGSRDVDRTDGRTDIGAIRKRDRIACTLERIPRLDDQLLPGVNADRRRAFWIEEVDLVIACQALHQISH